MLKLTPPGVTVAPSGAARPSAIGGTIGPAPGRDSSDVSVCFMFFLLRRGPAPRGCPSELEPGLRVRLAEEADERAGEAGPAGLMAGAEAGAVVAVEVLVEQ